MKRKNIILIILINILLSSSYSYGQEALKQGGYFLSGSIAFSSQHSDIDDGNQKFNTLYFQFQPSFNYFVFNRLAVGSSLYFSYRESENKIIYTWGEKDEFTLFHRSYGIGASIRYYLTGGTAAPFIGLEDFYVKTISSSKQNSFSASAGVNLFISRGTALEPFAAYQFKTRIGSEYSNSTFMIGIKVNYFILPEL